MTTAPIAPTISDRLDDTVVGRWLGRLARNTSPRRNHWRTKEIYYRAASLVLEAGNRPALNWRTIVTAAGERGSRSTFYEVAGAHARHRMVDDLINDGGSNSLQIALRYLRSDPVEQLIDETKIWSFWTHRRQLRGLLTAGMSAEVMESELSAALAGWAAQHPGLAAAVEHTPPACAVEDLTVIHRGRLSGTQAAQRLTEVVHERLAHR